MKNLNKLREQGALAVFLVVFAAASITIFYFAVPLWQEREALLLQQQKLEQRTMQIRRFAVSHSDYNSYAAERRQKLQALRLQFVKEHAVNRALESLSTLAANNAVLLREIKLPDKADARKEKITRGVKPYFLQLTAAGEFFAVLRWLRQTERQGFIVQSLCLQEEGMPGSVRAELEIALYGAE